MTALSLTAADQTRVAAALQSVFSPHDAPSETAWRLDVVRHLKGLVGGEAALFERPGGDGPPAVSDEYTGVLPAEYAALFPPLDRRYHLRARAARAGVVTGDEFWQEAPEAYRRSAYRNEFKIPNRMYHGLTVATRVPGGTGVAQVIVHRNSLTAPPFGAREKALFGLVLPAFQAAVAAQAALATRAAALAEALDAGGAALAVVALDGRTRHRTPALAALCEADPERDRLVHAVAQTARAVAHAHALTGSPPGPPSVVVRTMRAAYRVHATSCAAGTFGPDPVALVGVERAPAPSATGLTARERDVLRLLAEGLAQKQVADALGICHATVNGHVQRAFETLGVHTAAGAVAKALREGLI